MKQQILFIQGGGAGAHSADESLVGYLRSVLGPSYEVRYPIMPNEEDPEYERWRIAITKELTVLTGDVILIGHSLGGSFLLKYLSEEKVETTIAGVFLIAAPYWGGNGWRYEGYERVGLREDFVSKLPQGVPLYLYHSRDDEIVPFAHLSLYAEKLPAAAIRVVEGRGHQFANNLCEIVADLTSL
ncbi:MAG: serine hydrolase family protein [Verrucomicrobia bacterium]|nr:serine hydrolase family protein [Verrucomicrobiota bacterium]